MVLQHVTCHMSHAYAVNQMIIWLDQSCECSKDTREVSHERSELVIKHSCTCLQVSFVAHIAGGVAGMTIGYVFFSSYNQKLLKDPRFWLCIVGYVVFLVFAILFNIFLSPA